MTIKAKALDSIIGACTDEQARGNRPESKHSSVLSATAPVPSQVSRWLPLYPVEGRLQRSVTHNLLSALVQVWFRYTCL